MFWGNISILVPVELRVRQKDAYMRCNRGAEGCMRTRPVREVYGGPLVADISSPCACPCRDRAWRGKAVGESRVRCLPADGW